MVLKPTKDAVRLVRRYLEKNFGLEVVKTGLHHAPGYLTIKPSNTVIHVKGIQQESDSKSNSYYPSSFDYLKKGHTQFLVLVRYDKGNLGDSFILPLKIVERIFGGLSPAKIKKGNPHYVFSIKESEGKHSVKCHQQGGEWIDIEDYKNLSGWKQIPDIIRHSNKHETIPSNALRGRLEQQGLKDWASLTPADIEYTVNTVLCGDDQEGRLEIDREIIRRIINHLVSSKHVILVGPPGTGKTDLAKRLLRELGSRIIGNSEPVEAVASYEWGRYEVIGGNSLKERFHFGCITEAISKGSFLLIDEFNRADMNKAFSEMFLAIDHKRIELREDERPPGILNQDSSHPSIDIPPTFRMICTMNDYDKSLLNELSFGLLRRFAFVEIDIPRDKEKLKQVVVQRVNKDLSAFDQAVVVATINKNSIPITNFIDFILAISEKRKLGVSTVIDVIRYVIAGTLIRKEENAWKLLCEAMIDYVIPQIDRLDSDTLSHVMSKCSIFKGSDDSVIPEIGIFVSKLDEMKSKLQQLENLF